jgi:hypothetical protein
MCNSEWIACIILGGASDETLQYYDIILQEMSGGYCSGFWLVIIRYSEGIISDKHVAKCSSSFHLFMCYKRVHLDVDETDCIFVGELIPGVSFLI